jgi:amino acid adenylation domain-containing protein
VSTRTLQARFEKSASHYPDSTAVVEPGQGQVTYRQLDLLSSQVRDRLGVLGVARGHRVGICLRKSIDSVAAIYGILKTGAAYVPVDATAPAERNAYIMSNCEVTAVFVEAGLLPGLQAEIDRIGKSPQLIPIEVGPGGEGIRQAMEELAQQASAPRSPTVAGHADDLAYILYTSGSTGRPKGVMLSQENAYTFVDWCSEVFDPRQDDRFSSHAPFHFDLSVLDIHVCFKHGATLVLVNEDVGKDPTRLGRTIADEKITIWYSAPSILALLAQFGELSALNLDQLRHVLFAGEVFPVKHLRTLCDLLPGKRYFNLYGPTETNVCTYHEVDPPVPPDRTVPYPIGATCSHLQSRVVDEMGNDVAAGSEGELCIAGPGVMVGYWALPDLSEKAFLATADGTRWYRTGDIVVEAAGGIYTYRGRRDRMVKRRGYRVELGEIESGLYRHSRVEEAAVIAVPHEEGLQIVAFLASTSEGKASLIEMKRFCSQHLPLYMVPDRIVWLDELPKTSTDKIDYQRLKGLA